VTGLKSQDSKKEEYFAEKKRYIKNFKKAILLAIDKASEKFQKQLVYEQEILFNISDMIMALYVSESTLLRVEKLSGMKDAGYLKIYKDILDVNIYDAAARIKKSGLDAVNSFAEGEDLNSLARAINIFTEIAGVNIKEARRRIADKLIDDNKYSF